MIKLNSIKDILNPKIKQEMLKYEFLKDDYYTAYESEYNSVYLFDKKLSIRYEHILSLFSGENVKDSLVVIMSDTKSDTINQMESGDSLKINNSTIISKSLIFIGNNNFNDSTIIMGDYSIKDSNIESSTIGNTQNLTSDLYLEECEIKNSILNTMGGIKINGWKIYNSKLSHTFKNIIKENVQCTFNTCEITKLNIFNILSNKKELNILFNNCKIDVCEIFVSHNLEIKDISINSSSLLNGGNADELLKSDYDLIKKAIKNEIQTHLTNDYKKNEDLTTNTILSMVESEISVIDNATTYITCFPHKNLIYLYNNRDSFAKRMFNYEFSTELQSLFQEVKIFKLILKDNNIVFDYSFYYNEALKVDLDRVLYYSDKLYLYNDCGDVQEFSKDNKFSFLLTPSQLDDLVLKNKTYNFIIMGDKLYLQDINLIAKQNTILLAKFNKSMSKEMLIFGDSHFGTKITDTMVDALLTSFLDFMMMFSSLKIYTPITSGKLEIVTPNKLNELSNKILYLRDGNIFIVVKGFNNLIEYNIESDPCFTESIISQHLFKDYMLKIGEYDNSIIKSAKTKIIPNLNFSHDYNYYIFQSEIIITFHPFKDEMITVLPLLTFK